MILAVAALRCPDVFWRVGELDDLREASSADLNRLREELENLDAVFGYASPSRITKLADCAENAIGYLYGNLE